MGQKHKIAIIGATGLVGSTMLDILSTRLPEAEIELYASQKSAGKVIEKNNKKYVVKLLSLDNLPKNCEYAMMSAGSEVSGRFAPLFSKHGIITIDNSSRWRKDTTVPLIVPEVNATALKQHSNIISNPNCSTIQCVVALNRLQKSFGIKRIVYNTYQAVSGAGQHALERLKNHTQYYDDTIPHIDEFCEDGYTKEEHKMIFETQKIFSKTIPITATTVRVPVTYGHSVSINVELHQKTNLNEIKQILQSDYNIKFIDGHEYPTAKLAKGTDQVYVGRLRQDYSKDNTYNLWVVADNIRKGAATNAVQILEKLISMQD